MSKNDQINDNDMLRILDPMMHCICDKLCVMPRKGYDQEKLEEVCNDCEVGQYSIDILNAYERAQSQAERYSGIILCEECEYRVRVKGMDLHCCRACNGVIGYLKPGDGCSRGKKKDGEKNETD